MGGDPRRCTGKWCGRANSPAITTKGRGMTTPNTAPVKTIPVMRSTPPALATCNAASCRRPIEWVTTLYGKRRMPVDSPLIVVDAVERDGGLIVWIESRQSHFVSCPEALAFRDRVENKTRSVKRNPRRRDARW